MKISTATKIVLLSILAFGLQATGRAQGNLVNLYDWSPQTMYSSDPTEGVAVTSSTSVGLYSEFSTNYPFGDGPRLTTPSLAGNLATSIGAEYEITCAASHYGLDYQAYADLTFGNSYSMQVLLGTPFLPGPESTNFVWYVTASDPVTSMSIVAGTDTGDTVSLYISVIEVPQEVPEVSTVKLSALGIALFLAQRWRRCSDKRKGFQPVKMDSQSAAP